MRKRTNTTRQNIIIPDELLSRARDYGNVSLFFEKAGERYIKSMEYALRVAKLNVGCPVTEKVYITPKRRLAIDKKIRSIQ